MAGGLRLTVSREVQTLALPSKGSAETSRQGKGQVEEQEQDSQLRLTVSREVQTLDLPSKGSAETTRQVKGRVEEQEQDRQGRRTQTHSQQ